MNKALVYEEKKKGQDALYDAFSLIGDDADVSFYLPAQLETLERNE